MASNTQEYLVRLTGDEIAGLIDILELGGSWRGDARIAELADKLNDVEIEIQIDAFMQAENVIAECLKNDMKGANMTEFGKAMAEVRERTGETTVQIIARINEERN